MAAGIAYSQALFKPEPNPIIVNIGIAGHKSYPLGGLWLINKIADNDTGRRFYPPLVFTPPCPTAELITFAKPQENYPDLALCDMEASAFYETAARFTTGEFIQCLKIVSDNEQSPTQAVNPAQVSALIAAQFANVNLILQQLTEFAHLLTFDKVIGFEQINQQHHFTVNQQIQLKKLLHRNQLIDAVDTLEDIRQSAKTGEEFLQLLTRQLDKAEFYL